MEHFFNSPENQDSFNYLIVITGIIIGLGITQVLGNIGSIIAERKKINFYWPFIGWQIMIFLVFIQYWFNLYETKNYSQNFLEFISSIIFPLGIYLSSAIMSIKSQLGNKTDLKKHFYEQARWFYIIISISLVYLVIHDIIFFDAPLFWISNLIRVGSAICLFYLAFQKKEILHKIFCIMLFGVYVLFVIVN